MNDRFRPSREIDGRGRTIRELLVGRKHSVGYDRREYKWQRKQVAGWLVNPRFKAHAELKRTDLDGLHGLYQQVVERTWSPERLELGAES